MYIFSGLSSSIRVHVRQGNLPVLRDLKINGIHEWDEHGQKMSESITACLQKKTCSFKFRALLCALYIVTHVQSKYYLKEICVFHKHQYLHGNDSCHIEVNFQAQRANQCLRNKISHVGIFRCCEIKHIHMAVVWNETSGRINGQDAYEDINTFEICVCDSIGTPAHMSSQLAKVVVLCQAVVRVALCALCALYSKWAHLSIWALPHIEMFQALSG